MKEHNHVLQKIIIILSFLCMCIPLHAQSETEYVGFSSYDEEKQTYDYAKMENGHGVQKYYIVPYALFSSSLSQNSIISASSVAYCFNYHLSYPVKSGNAYTFVSNASADAFDQAVGEEKRKEKEELYEAIVRIANNGYPHDHAGIQKKYGLQDDAFRLLTQYAIWYYTDSVDLVFEDTHYNVFQNGRCLSMEDAKPLNYSLIDHLKEAYEQLLQAECDQSDVSHIQLYMPKDASFQSLLRVASVPKKETNTSSLTITKQLIGNEDVSDKFHFTIELFDASLKPLEGSYPLSNKEILTLKEGKGEIVCANRESMTIHALPEGTFYTIKEEDTEGYELVSSTNATNIGSTALSAEQEITASFINRKKGTYEAIVQAKKELVDQTLQADAFTFVMEDEEGNTVSTTNDAQGNICFPSFSYTKQGIYTYTMYEVKGNDPDITYDETKKKVNVIVGNEDIIRVMDREDLVLKENMIEGVRVYPFTQETAEGNCRSIIDPSASDYRTLENTISFPDDIAEKVSKLLYYSETHPFDETMIPYYETEVTFSEALFQKLLRYLSSSQTNAYLDKLMESILSQTVPAAFSTVLFLNEANTSAYVTGRMNTVTIDMDETPFINTFHAPSGRLTLKKQVEGESEDHAFTFAIKIDGFDGQCTSKKIDSLGNEEDISLDWKQSETSVSLKHNETLVLEGLPSRFSYTIEEKDASGYEMSSLEDPLHAENVEEAEILIQNRKKTYSFRIIKVNEAKQRMEGVGFEVYTDEACEKKYIDEMLLTNENGEIALEGMQEGTYYLKEVETNEGYALLEDVVCIQLPQESTVTLINQPISYEIPSLGSKSNVVYEAVSLVLLLITAAVLVKQRRRG